MKDLVGILALVAVAAAAYTGWRLFCYPGGWAYAFSAAHADARADLDGARQRAGALERESKKERDAAHARLQREQPQHRERIRASSGGVATSNTSPNGTKALCVAALTSASPASPDQWPG